MNAPIANPDAIAGFSARIGSPSTTKNTNMKIVINRCFGGFGLSEAAYAKLIEWGVPVKPYVEQKRDEATKRYLPEPANEGEIIFDRTLTPEQQFSDAEHIRRMGRYWETWLDKQRTHPLLVRAVEELGKAANGNLASLKVVEIPDGTEWKISEYDGSEHVAEKHQTWD